MQSLQGGLKQFLYADRKIQKGVLLANGTPFYYYTIKRDCV